MCSSTGGCPEERNARAHTHTHTHTHTHKRPEGRSISGRVDIYVHTHTHTHTHTHVSIYKRNAFLPKSLPASLGQLGALKEFILAWLDGLEVLPDAVVREWSD
jgi:hypothetical protein